MNTNSARPPAMPPSVAAVWRTEISGLRAEWNAGLSVLRAEWTAECRRADTPGVWPFASTFTAITATVWLLWGSGTFHDSVTGTLRTSAQALRAGLANLFGWMQ